MKNTHLFFIRLSFAPAPRSFFVFLFLFLFLDASTCHAQTNPSLLWATYFSGYDEGNTIANDDSGNIYITGTTYSYTGLATKGAYQTTGDSVYGDAFIAKFSSSGSLIWATYYGGDNWESGDGITVDDNNNVYIIGTTASRDGIATKGAYQTALRVTQDAFIAKFTSSGSLIWGTYFGHGLGDGGSGIITDRKDNVYVIGDTYMDDTSIATSGAYETTAGGGWDVFLAKFDSSGSLKWSTYYGGANDDYGYGITTDNNNVYIIGETQSTSGISTSGAYQTSVDSVNGNPFIAKFTSLGTLVWGTYYGGSGGGWGTAITADTNKNVYITGQTYSDSGIATSGAYDTKGNSSSNAFIAKFTSTGSLTWGTYFGGDKFAGGSSIISDASNNIYLNGGTYSINGVATSGAFQTIGDSVNGSAFVAKFTSSGYLTWCTYYGKNSDGGAISLGTYDGVYILGNTKSASGIATSGAYQTNYEPGQFGDAYLAKFTSSPCLFFPEITGIDTLCQNSIASYSATVHGANTYSWKTVGGIIIFGRNKDTVAIQWSAIGNDTLWLVESSGSCKDSVAKTILVNKQPSLKLIPVHSICIGNSDSIGVLASHGNTYQWKSKPTGLKDTISQITISPTLTSTYYLTAISSVGCSTTDSIIVKVNPLPNANAGTSKVICSGDSTTIGAAAVTGNSYSWVSSPIGFTSTEAGSSPTPTITSTYILTETTIATGCSKTDSVIITVNPLPTTPTITLSGDTLTSSAKSGNQWYRDSVIIRGATNQQYVATENGNYSVMITDSNGCSATSASVNYILTGIEGGVDDLQLSIYPNPFTNQTTISGKTSENSAFSLSVYDVTGRLITSENNISHPAGVFSYTFDPSQYGCGIYIVKLMMGNEVVTREIVKIR